MRNIPTTQLFNDLLNQYLEYEVWSERDLIVEEIGLWGMSSPLLEVLFDYWAEREGRALLTPEQLDLARALVRNGFIGTLDELIRVAPLCVDVEYSPRAR